MHWAVIGVILALGMFFVYSYGTTLDFGGKDFTALEVGNVFEQAEIDKYYLERSMQHLAWETVLDLAAVGGMPDQYCGEYLGYTLWNNKVESCYVEEGDGFVELFASNFALESNSLFYENEVVLGGDYSSEDELGDVVLREVETTFPEDFAYEFSYEGGRFSGKSSEEVFISDDREKISYSFSPSFSVDLGYGLSSEYAVLKEESALLLASCSSSLLLRECLEREMKDRWHFMHCDLPAYQEERRQVAFCVESPGEEKVFKGVSELVPVQYKFALDFSSPGAFPVQDLIVGYDAAFDLYEISFVGGDVGLAADWYHIYLTTYDDSMYVGPIEDFLGYQFSGIYFEEFAFSSEDVSLECPLTNPVAVAGGAFACGDRVYYYLAPEDLPSLPLFEEYFVGVGAWEGGEESVVNGFVALPEHPLSLDIGSGPGLEESLEEEMATI